MSATRETPRTDTQYIPITAGRPMPARLSPRATFAGVVTVFAQAAAVFVAAAVLLPLIVVLAYFVPQSVIVTLLVLIVAVVIVRKAMQATAGAR